MVVLESHLENYNIGKNESFIPKDNIISEKSGSNCSYE